MANSGANTNTSQFYITFTPTTHLDLKHTVFGHVVGGLGVLDTIEQISSSGKHNTPNSEIKIIKMCVFNNPIPMVEERLKQCIIDNMECRLELYRKERMTIMNSGGNSVSGNSSSNNSGSSQSKSGDNCTNNTTTTNTNNINTNNTITIATEVDQNAEQVKRKRSEISESVASGIGLDSNTNNNNNTNTSNNNNSNNNNTTNKYMKTDKTHQAQATQASQAVSLSLFMATEGDRTKQDVLANTKQQQQLQQSQYKSNTSNNNNNSGVGNSSNNSSGTQYIKKKTYGNFGAF